MNTQLLFHGRRRLGEVGESPFVDALERDLRKIWRRRAYRRDCTGVAYTNTRRRRPIWLRDIASFAAVSSTDARSQFTVSPPIVIVDATGAPRSYNLDVI